MDMQAQIEVGAQLLDRAYELIRDAADEIEHLYTIVTDEDANPDFLAELKQYAEEFAPVEGRDE